MAIFEHRNVVQSVNRELCLTPHLPLRQNKPIQSLQFCRGRTDPPISIILHSSLIHDQNPEIVEFLHLFPTEEKVRNKENLLEFENELSLGQWVTFLQEKDPNYSSRARSKYWKITVHNHTRSSLTDLDWVCEVEKGGCLWMWTTPKTPEAVIEIKGDSTKYWLRGAG